MVVAIMEQITKKNAAELPPEAGLSNYLGKKIAYYIQAEQLAREKNDRCKQLGSIQNSPLRKKKRSAHN
jgi:hypothetical protein